MVASKLGIALLPKTAVRPVMRAMETDLAARLQGHGDADSEALVDFLVQPSPNAKAAAPSR